MSTVSVLNLGTGTQVPLSEAEKQVPSGLNPLSLHIMRRTKEYLSDPNLQEEQTGRTLTRHGVIIDACTDFQIPDVIINLLH